MAMDKREIWKRVKSLKEPEKRIEYLKGILRKKGLLHKDTAFAIHELIGQQYEILARQQDSHTSTNFFNAAENYQKAGKQDLAVGVIRKLLRGEGGLNYINHGLQAAQFFEGIRLKDEAKQVLNKRIELYGESADRFEKIADDILSGKVVRANAPYKTTESASYFYQKAIDFYNEGGIYAKAGNAKIKLDNAILLEEKDSASNRRGLLLRVFGKKSRAVASIIGLVGAILFFSPNFTGNAIGNMTNSTSNILGTVFILVALVGGFFWFRSRR